MSNMTVTNVDTGSIELRDGEYEESIFTAAGPATYKAGTLLARLSATGAWVPFVLSGGAGGNDVIKAVLTKELVAAGAGDIGGVRALVKGVVNKDRLIVHSAGDGDDITKAHLDAMRDYGIVAVPVNQLAQLDNQ